MGATCFPARFKVDLRDRMTGAVCLVPFSISPFPCSAISGPVLASLHHCPVSVQHEFPSHCAVLGDDGVPGANAAQEVPAVPTGLGGGCRILPGPGLSPPQVGSIPLHMCWLELVNGVTSMCHSFTALKPATTASHLASQLWSRLTGVRKAAESLCRKRLVENLTQPPSSPAPSSLLWLVFFQVMFFSETMSNGSPTSQTPWEVEIESGHV